MSNVFSYTIFAAPNAATNPVNKVVVTKEINFVADFGWEPAISATEEIDQLTSGHWSPGKDDFTEVAGGTPVLARTFGNLLGKIYSEQDGSIKQINLFTHANSDLIGFGGTIQKSSTSPGAAVFINTNNGPNDNMTAMDQTSMINLSQPGITFITDGNKSITIDDIRKKFAPGAIFALYGCHTGQIGSFINSIAQFFKIKVIGFRQAITFYPPPQNDPTRFVRRGEQIGIGSGPKVSNFRDLTKNLADPGIVVGNP